MTSHRKSHTTTQTPPPITPPPPPPRKTKASRPPPPPFPSPTSKSPRQLTGEDLLKSFPPPARPPHKQTDIKKKSRKNSFSSSRIDDAPKQSSDDASLSDVVLLESSQSSLQKIHESAASNNGNSSSDRLTDSIYDIVSNTDALINNTDYILGMLEMTKRLELNSSLINNNNSGESSEGGDIRGMHPRQNVGGQRGSGGERMQNQRRHQCNNAGSRDKPNGRSLVSSMPSMSVRNEMTESEIFKDQNEEGGKGIATTFAVISATDHKSASMTNLLPTKRSSFARDRKQVDAAPDNDVKSLSRSQLADESGRIVPPPPPNARIHPNQSNRQQDRHNTHNKRGNNTDTDDMIAMAKRLSDPKNCEIDEPSLIEGASDPQYWKDVRGRPKSKRQMKGSGCVVKANMSTNFSGDLSEGEMSQTSRRNARIHPNQSNRQQDRHNTRNKRGNNIDSDDMIAMAKRLSDPKNCEIDDPSIIEGASDPQYWKDVRGRPKSKRQMKGSGYVVKANMSTNFSGDMSEGETSQTSRRSRGSVNSKRSTGSRKKDPRLEASRKRKEEHEKRKQAILQEKEQNLRELVPMQGSGGSVDRRRPRQIVRRRAVVNSQTQPQQRKIGILTRLRGKKTTHTSSVASNTTATSGGTGLDSSLLSCHLSQQSDSKSIRSNRSSKSSCSRNSLHSTRRRSSCENNSSLLRTQRNGAPQRRNSLERSQHSFTGSLGSNATPLSAAASMFQSQSIPGGIQESCDEVSSCDSSLSLNSEDESLEDEDNDSDESSVALRRATVAEAVQHYNSNSKLEKMASVASGLLRSAKSLVSN
jgi:hypothetical protein